MAQRVPLIYFGHHKAGSIWITSVMKYIAELYGLRLANFHAPGMFDGDLAKRIRKDKLDFVAYTNAEYNQVNVEHFKGLHIVRDPRDMLVSAYYSHMNSHPTDYWPELEAHRKRLKSMDLDEGLLVSMEFTFELVIDGERLAPFEAMNSWNADDPRILEVKFERLTQQPYEAWPEIIRHHGLLDDAEVSLRSVPGQLVDVVRSRFGSQSAISFPRWMWLMAVDSQSFKKISGGRAKGQEATKSHFRKGVPGDWKNHFKEEHKALFKQKYPDLLQRLGYETDGNW